jgi:hypothetical protein
MSKNMLEDIKIKKLGYAILAMLIMLIFREQSKKTKLILLWVLLILKKISIDLKVYKFFLYIFNLII